MVTPTRFVWGVVSGLAFIGTYQLFRWRKRKYASGETKGPVVGISHWHGSNSHAHQRGDEGHSHDQWAWSGWSTTNVVR